MVDYQVILKQGSRFIYLKITFVFLMYHSIIPFDRIKSLWMKRSPILDFIQMNILFKSNTQHILSMLILTLSTSQAELVSSGLLSWRDTTIDWHPG